MNLRVAAAAGLCAAILACALASACRAGSTVTPAAPAGGGAPQDARPGVYAGVVEGADRVDVTLRLERGSFAIWLRWHDDPHEEPYGSGTWRQCGSRLLLRYESRIGGLARRGDVRVREEGLLFVLQMPEAGSCQVLESEPTLLNLVRADEG